LPDAAADVATGSEAKAGIAKFITFYNDQRPHVSLDEKTPSEAYWQSGRAGTPVPAGPQAVA